MKERMVTRTITSNICNLVIVNLKGMEVVKSRAVAPADCDTVEKADKFFRKTWEADGYAFAKVESIEKVEKLYGMTESDFIKYAKELPPRAVKEE